MSRKSKKGFVLTEEEAMKRPNYKRLTKREERHLLNERLIEGELLENKEADARMNAIRKYTTTELTRHPTIFSTALPFYITSGGKVIAQCVSPDAVWYLCEHCGENTQNIIQFVNEEGELEKLVLCNICKKYLLG